jgi:hypothetical protein
MIEAEEVAMAQPEPLKVMSSMMPSLIFMKIVTSSPQSGLCPSAQ